MFEIGDPHKPRGSSEPSPQDLSAAGTDDYSLAGKKHFGERPGASEARIVEDTGSSLVSICLRKHIAIRQDEGSLDLSPEFCGILIQNLAIFGDKIQKFCYDQIRLKEVLRCCMLSSVLEFYDWKYSQEVSEVVTFVQSLIVSDTVRS